MSTLSARLRYCCRLGRANPRGLANAIKITYSKILVGEQSREANITPVRRGTAFAATLPLETVLKLYIRAQEITERSKDDDS